MNVQHLSTLLDYNHWANRESLATLRANAAPPQRARRLLAHLMAAEHLWLTRIRGEDARVAVWPEMALDEIATAIASLKEKWREVIAAGDAELGRKITYTNSKGEPWESAVRDIVMHVITHGAYHRGQIAADLRASGGIPAYTDYIQAVRSGAVQGLAE
jgi:uncharacterized damage-inducible protein DinB